MEQACGAGGQDNAAMTRPQSWIATLLAASTAACSPTLDWREFVPEGIDLRVTFPCRPERYARTVVLAGAKLQMDMLVCAAGETTYALSFANVVDPARISATLDDLRASAVGNVHGSEPRLMPLQISGMTPNERALRLTTSGRLPDGSAVQEHAAFFARGLRVYQASVIGAKPAPEVVEAFLGGLKFRP